MLKRIQSIITAVLVVLSHGELSAQGVDYAGTSVANFLKIGVGSRAVGLGEAAVSVVDDASALFWNVGALGRLQHGSATFSTMPWLVDSRVTYVAAALPLSFGTVGIDLDYFTSGEMEMTTLQEQDGTGRFFSASDFQLGLGFSRELTDRFSVGLKVKFVQEDLVGTKASGFGFDLGSVFVTNFFHDLRLGMTLSNFGSRLRFDGRDLAIIYRVPDSPSNKEVPARLQTESWELPLYFRFGVATAVIRQEQLRLTAAYDIMDSRDFDTRHHLGGELTLLELLALRGGYRFNYSEAGASFGAGLDLHKYYDKGLRFDFVSSDLGRFDSVQQFSIVVGF